jgi:ABC-type transporter Mla subunit MlaD
MRFITIILALWCALILGGCSVDLEQTRAELAKLEQQSKELRAYIAANQSVMDQLKALAAATGDQTFAAAAEKIQAGISVAVAKLPEVEATLKTSQEKLAQLEKDAAGKVPWYSVAGGLFLAIVPRVLGVLIPGAKPIAELVAEWGWKALATRRQQKADAEGKA